MTLTTQEDPATGNGNPNPAPPSEFSYLPIEQIIVGKQIRTKIKTNCDSFTGLMASIREKGLLEPLLVMAQGDGTYLLICGERRFRACQMLGMEVIPVRILGQGMTQAEAISIQLVENLNRENLNPIDEARAYLNFFQTKVGPLDADGMMSNIVTYERDPARVDKAFAANFAAITKITGKSPRSMSYLFSLLQLPEEIQAALVDGRIGLSQGYLFAAHLDDPKLMDVFAFALENPVTYEDLKKLLKGAPGKRMPAAPKPPFAGFYTNMKTVRTAWTKGTAKFTNEDIEALVKELETFCAQLKEQAGKVAAP